MSLSLQGIIFILGSSILVFLLIRNSTRSKQQAHVPDQQFFENSPIPMWVYEESSLRFLAVNQSAIDKYGFSKEEFLKQKLPDVYLPNRKADFYKNLKEQQEGYQESGPFQHRKKSGEYFYVQIHSTSILFHEKKARLVVALDVDKNMQAKEKNREAYRKLNDLRSAVSSATIVSVLDLTGTITYANPNLCRLSKYADEELRGENIRTLISEQHPASFFDEMWKRLHMGQIWRGEIKNVAKDKSTFWLDMSIVPIKNRAGEVFQYVSISSDISEKKQVQDALVRREKLLSSLINSHTSYLIRLDEHGFYNYANARYLKKFNFKLPELVNHHFQNLLAPEDIAKFRQARKSCMENPGKIVSLELRSAHAENSLSWTSWEFVCLESANDFGIEIQGMGLDITKRKIAELELERYDKRLDKVLDSINEAYYTIDRNWRLLKVNKEFERIFKKRREEILGSNIWEVFPEIVDTPFYHALHKSMIEGIPLSFEEEFSSLGLWFQMNIYPTTEGVSGYCRDISRKVESDREIKQAIIRYDTLTKASFDTIWEWDLCQNALLWNDGIETHFKYPKEQIPKTIKWWAKKVHPEDYQRIVKGIRKLIRKKEVQWQEEYRFLCGNGAYRYISNRGYLIYDDQQNPIRMIGAIQDIHTQREYQQEIKKLSLVAEKTQNTVVITNKKGEIEWVNEGFVRLTGWKAEEVKGRKPGSFLQGPATDRETKEKIHQNLLKKDRFSAELVNYTKEGFPYWVRMDVSPIFDEAGEIVKFIAIESDITERKHFEEMLKRQNEQLKEIAWISSHDVRRPVASIMGLISLYDKEDPGKPFNLEIIGHLNTASKELDKVIRKIVYKTYEVSEIKKEDEINKVTDL